jgi:hypothetical protein
MELATAAKRLAAVVYPMGSGSVRRDKVRHGQARYGAFSGRPVGNSWSSSRCGLVGLSEARFGAAW